MDAYSAWLFGIASGFLAGACVGGFFASIVLIPKVLPDRRVIARRAIAASRAADAAISEQALQAEFQLWWRAMGWPDSTGIHLTRSHLAWGRHLLRRGAGG